MTDVLTTRTRFYRCEEAAGNLVDAKAGKIFTATALAYQQTNLLNFSVKGNGTTAFIEQTDAAGADAYNIPLGQDRTYAFFVKTSASPVEYYLHKRHISVPHGISVGRASSNRANVFVGDGVSSFNFLSAVNTLLSTTKYTIIVRIRRSTAGLSVRVNGVEKVVAAVNTSTLGAVTPARNALAFAQRNDANVLSTFTAHEQDEMLVWNTRLTDAECAIVENAAAFRDLSVVPVLSSVDVAAAVNLDSAFQQVVTGDHFDLQPPAFTYPGIGSPASVVVNSRTQATLTWNLTGKAPGTYALQGPNDNGAATPLAAALVLTGGLQVRAPSRFESRIGPFSVRVPSSWTSRIQRMSAGQHSRLDSLTRKGWDIFARHTVTGAITYIGFIDGDAMPKEIVDFPLADGSYEIEARPSDWLWQDARGSRVATLLTDPPGGGSPATGLPVIQNLRSEVVRFKSRIRWDVAQEASPEAFRFGLWFGPTPGVDTSGPPDAIVRFVAGTGTYEFIHTQVAQEYVAIAAFTATRQGLVSELLLTWDTVAPDSPEGQHADTIGFERRDPTVALGFAGTKVPVPAAEGNIDGDHSGTVYTEPDIDGGFSGTVYTTQDINGGGS